MKPSNIDLLGIFQEADDGAVSKLDQVFQGVARGTNTYVHLEEATFTLPGDTAFTANDAGEIEAFIGSMKTLGATRFYLNVGLEPTAGYDYATSPNGLAIATKLANDLLGYQQVAALNGAVLEVYVRYASEMNLGSYLTPPPQAGGMHSACSRSFQVIASTLKGINPSIQMVFSPAINFETNDDTLHLFWPGANFVDVIACTWYINGATANTSTSDAITNMTDYFLHRLGASTKFGIDELGGWNPAADNQNDSYLGLMFEGIAQISGQVDFAYVTAFLQNNNYVQDGQLVHGAQWNHDPVTLGIL
jgi:hypothetical protein